MAITPRTKKLLETYVRKQVLKIINEEATRGQNALEQVKQLVSKLNQKKSELKKARQKAVELDIDVPEIHDLRQQVNDIKTDITRLGGGSYTKSEISRTEWDELRRLVDTYGLDDRSPSWGSKNHPNYMM